LRGMEWIHLAQNRDKWQAVVCTVMNPWFPWNVENLLTSWGTSSFSRSTVLCGVGYLVVGGPFCVWTEHHGWLTLRWSQACHHGGQSVWTLQLTE
jgi:hypothetical protein